MNKKTAQMRGFFMRDEKKFLFQIEVLLTNFEAFAV